MKAHLPSPEAERLEALRRYEVLDTAPEPELDDLTHLAAQICGTPFSAITLVDQERQWFKSRVGIPLRETPRDISFCAHTIQQSDILLVPDTVEDELFADNPFVTGEPSVRFYAGVPLVTPEGQAVGALCVLDTVPRALDQTQQDALRRLARQVVVVLEARPEATAAKGQSRHDRQQAEQQRRALAAEAARQEAISFQASEERYRRLFEAAKDGILILDAASGKIEDVNPYLCQLLGYEPVEFVGKQLWQIGCFHDIAASQQAFTTLQEHEYIRYNDLPLETKEGSKAWVEFISNVYVAGDRKVIQCNIRDISERKRAEANERESKRFLQSTLDALALHIAVLDEKGTIIAVNKAWRQFADDNDGNDASCGVGANYIEVCERASGDWSEEAPALAEAIPAVIGGQHRAFCLEYSCHSPQEERWFNVCVTRFVGEGPTYAVVAHENISERKRAEQQILTSQANLAKAQQIAHMGSWELDLACADDINKNALRWSDEVFRIFGYEPGQVEVSNENFFRAVHPGDQEIIASFMAQALRECKPYRVEHRILLPDGGERRVREQSEIVFDESTGEPLKMVGTVQDITEQKQTEEFLRQSSEQLRALAASLSTVREEERTQIARDVHDVLGQALTGLKMDVAWLEERLLADGASVESPMLRKTGAMLPFIDVTIQSVQRIASQLRPALLDDFGLEAAIEWQLQEWKERTHMRCDYVSSLGDTSLSPEQSTAVFRILQESLTNIARHAAATRISVLLEENAGHLVLEVQDNGRGIKERRAAAAKVKSLGLLGMQERARLVGGEVTIVSSEGRGTTVTVRVPLHQEVEP